MAYSNASLSATEQALLAADKPILLSQSIPLAPTSVIWTESGSVGATDRTATGYPTYRAYDGFPDLVTKTNTTASHTWYLTMQLSTAGVEFDAVGIMGHNLGTLHAGGALTITLELSDASNFAGAVSIPITVTTSTSNARILALSLKHTGSDPLRYSAVVYARLKITRAATDFVPEIGELLLLRRRQLKHKPTLPYDETSLHSTNEITRTQGGRVFVYGFATGFRKLSATLDTKESPYNTDLISFFSATEYGVRPFVWIENPNSAATSWHYMVLDDPDFDFPTEGISKRTWQIEATEQGPESHYLSKGNY